MPRQCITRTEAEWNDIIRRCKQSGLSDRAWCGQNGISTTSFYRYLRKFHAQTGPETGSAMIPKKELSSVPEVHDVVPLIIMDETPAQQNPRIVGDVAGEAVAFRSSIRINSGDISLEIANDADSELVAEIIRSLRFS